MAIWIWGSCLGLVVIYFSVRYAWWLPAVDWSRPRVLMYHMVREHRKGARFNKLRVRPRDFEKQMAWLSQREFSFIFASDLVGENLPIKSVCVTFDDGYRDNLLEADRVLKSVGGRATLYLVENREGGWSSKKKAHHSDDELASEPKLTNEEVQSMLESGRWQLGGHTASHANLVKLSSEEALAEIANARDSFAKEFGCEALTFAYPFGIFEEMHSAMVQQAGYVAAVTTESGIPQLPLEDPFQISRIKVSGKEGLLGFVMRLRRGKRGLSK